MTETRRYTIEVKDAKSKSAVVAAVVDWTSDDKQVAVAQIFRLPGLAGSNGLAHRLSQQRLNNTGAHHCLQTGAQATSIALP